MNQKNALTDHERMGDAAFEQAVAEFFAKELSKPKPIIIYLPTAQRQPESFFQPLPID